MSLFIYIGYDKFNNKVIDSKNFSSREKMNIFLVKNSIKNYEIFESETKKIFGLFQTVSSKELSVFCKQLSILLYSDISLKEAILLLSEEVCDKQLKKALNEILNHMKNGIDLFEAITMYKHIFGAYLINMIKLGEKSNSLAYVFSTMSSYFEKEEIIRSKVKYCVAYPTIVTLFMTCVILLIILKMLPVFKNMLISNVGDIPYVSNTFLYLITSLGFVSLILLLSLIGVYYYICSNKDLMRIDEIKIKIPFFRLISIKAFTARVSIGLALLLKSGMTLTCALEYVSILAHNEYLADKYNDAVKRFKEGERLDIAFRETGVFPNLFLSFVIVAVKSKKYEEIFEKSANYFSLEAEEAVHKLTSIIEPVLIAAVSVIILIILLSLIIPMINIMSYIG